MPFLTTKEEQNASYDKDKFIKVLEKKKINIFKTVFNIICVRGGPKITILDLSELSANFEQNTPFGKEVLRL